MPAGHTAEQPVSAALLAAQQRLLALRRQFAARPRPQQPVSAQPPAPAPGALSQQLANAQKELRRRREAAGIAPAQKPTSDTSSINSPLITPNNTPKPQPDEPEATVTVYPSLLLAILKQNQEAAGRIYLLLRHLDTAGRGWLPVAEIRAQLARKGAPLNVVGWRRLRQIFHQGEGIFWERDDQGRLWLRSALKIALKLACPRLQGKRVALPLTALLGGIGTVRAHFYASFHSGRKHDNPISRETLETVTGVCPRTQRAYDRVARVQRQRNIAVGPRHSAITAEEQTWQRGRGVFTFVDSQGKQGPKNRHYVAWRLPNSYRAPHAPRARGRQKKINQQLVSLVDNGVQGNDQQAVEKLFWPDGAAAGKAYGRDPDVDAYWPRSATQRRPGVVWHALVAREK